MLLFVFYLNTLLAAFFLTESLCYAACSEPKRDVWWLRVLALLVNGGLAYLLCLQWHAWQIIPVVVVLHAAVEWIPTPLWRSFAIKQGTRLVLIAAAAFWLAESLVFRLTPAHELYVKALLLFNGGSLAIIATGALVGKLTEQLALENQLTWRGLDNGGLWIGRLERLLIFMFVMLGMPSGIGFLVAAKSILRFSNTRDDQKMAEYVLIGTLTSFSLAILFAYLAKTGLSYINTL